MCQNNVGAGLHHTCYYVCIWGFIDDSLLEHINGRRHSLTHLFPHISPSSLPEDSKVKKNLSSILMTHIMLRTLLLVIITYLLWWIKSCGIRYWYLGGHSMTWWAGGHVLHLVCIIDYDWSSQHSSILWHFVENVWTNDCLHLLVSPIPLMFGDC